MLDLLSFVEYLLAHIELLFEIDGGAGLKESRCLLNRLLHPSPRTDQRRADLEWQAFVSLERGDLAGPIIQALRVGGALIDRPEVLRVQTAGLSPQDIALQVYGLVVVSPDPDVE